MVRLHLNNCLQIRALQHQKDKRLAESIQRRATKMGKGPESNTDEERLRPLVCSAQSRAGWGEAWWRLQLLTGSGGAALSSALCDSDRARGNGMELSGEGSWGWESCPFCSFWWALAASGCLQMLDVSKELGFFSGKRKKEKKRKSDCSFLEK